MHAKDLLDLIRARVEEPVVHCAFELLGEIIVTERIRLSEYLRSDRGLGVSQVLEAFSLDRILADAGSIATRGMKLARITIL